MLIALDADGVLKERTDDPIMLVSTVLVSTPAFPVNLADLFLKLDKEWEFSLPDGYPATGILRDVTPLGDNDNMVTLTLEVDDRYEPFFLTDCP